MEELIFNKNYTSTELHKNELILNVCGDNFIFKSSIILKTSNTDILKCKYDKFNNKLYFLVVLNENIILFYIDEEDLKAMTNDLIKISENIKINKFCKNVISHKINKNKIVNKVIKLLYKTSKTFIYGCLLVSGCITIVKVNNQKQMVTVKNYRYSGFTIHKMFYLSEEKSFTGEDIELLCSVYYDKKEKRVVNFHKVLLPNLESEVILDHSTLILKLDDSHFFKLSEVKLDGITNFVLLYNFENCFNLAFISSNLEIKKIKLSDEISQIDSFKWFTYLNYIYLTISTNNLVRIYKVNKDDISCSNVLEVQNHLEFLVFNKEVYYLQENNETFKLNFCKFPNLKIEKVGSININEKIANKRKNLVINKHIIYYSFLGNKSSEFEVENKIINKFNNELYFKSPQLILEKEITFDSTNYQVIEFYKALNILLIKTKSNERKIIIYDVINKKNLFETSDTLIEAKLYSGILYLFFSGLILSIKDLNINRIDYKTNESLKLILNDDKIFYLIFDSQMWNFSDNNLTEMKDTCEITLGSYFSKWNNYLIVNDSNQLGFYMFKNFKVQKLNIDVVKPELTLKEVYLTSSLIVFVISNDTLCLYKYKLENNTSTMKLEDCIHLIDNHINLNENRVEIKQVESKLYFYFINKDTNHVLNIKIVDDNKFSSYINLSTAGITNEIRLTKFQLDLFEVKIDKIYFAKLDEEKHDKTIMKKIQSEKVIKIKTICSKYMVVYTSIGQEYNLFIYDIFSLSQPLIELNFLTEVLDFEIQRYSHSLIFFILTKLNQNSSNVLLFKFEEKKTLDNNQPKLNEIPVKESSDNSYYNLTQTKNFQLENILLTDIKVLSTLNIIILNSKYGILKLYTFDSYLNFKEFYEFSYSSHLVEISKLKNDYENRDDLVKIFNLDNELDFLEGYIFFDSIVFTKPTITDNFKETFIILIFNFGVIINRLISDVYTSFRRINFFQQLSFHNKQNTYKYSLNKEGLLLIKFEVEEYKLKFDNDKFTFI